MPNLAAQLCLELVSADGKTQPFVARLLVPEPDGADWVCEVQFEGCFTSGHRVFGVDSWQALNLALKYVHINLHSMLSPGARLLYLGEPTDLLEIFGHPLTHTRASMQSFAPGQVWTYDTRPGEEASRIVVCRVESDAKLGQIVHIHVNGLRLKNKHAPPGFVDEIGHMPYAAGALLDSVTDLESTGTVNPRFEDGYRDWRSAFDQGNAGVWTIAVSQAIAAMESVLNQ